MQNRFFSIFPLKNFRFFSKIFFHFQNVFFVIEKKSWEKNRITISKQNFARNPFLASINATDSYKCLYIIIYGVESFFHHNCTFQNKTIHIRIIIHIIHIYSKIFRKYGIYSRNINKYFNISEYICIIWIKRVYTDIIWVICTS